MTGYLNNDGSGLVGGQLPSGAGQALQLDNSGNLKTTATLSAAANQRVNAQSGDFVDGSIVTLGTEADAAWTLSGNATAIALLKKLALLLQSVAYDNTSELKASIYGKNAAAGDTALGLDASGRITALLQAVAGTALGTDQAGTELKVSLYGTNAAGGDTALGINGSGNLKTNINGISAGVQFNNNLNQVLGAALSVSNPVLIQQAIRAAIIAGEGFTYATPKLTGGGANVTGLSVFNPSGSGKTLYVYAAKVGCAGSNFHQLNMGITVDPALGTSANVSNHKGGGGASVASATYTNANVATAGNIEGIIYVAGNTTGNFVDADDFYTLPPGNGIAIYANASTNGYGLLIKAVEF